MPKQLILTVALAVAGSMAHAQQPAPAEPAGKAAPSRDAKAAFIKKCFRNQTKAACEAPPAARVKN